MTDDTDDTLVPTAALARALRPDTEQLTEFLQRLAEALQHELNETDSRTLH
jgi:hypothetical protein